MLEVTPTKILAAIKSITKMLGMYSMKIMKFTGNTKAVIPVKSMK